MKMKRKNKFYKKWWFYIVVLLLIIIGISFLGISQSIYISNIDPKDIKETNYEFKSLEICGDGFDNDADGLIDYDDECNSVCDDNDGKNIYNKGIVNYRNNLYVDKCSTTKIKEYYCLADRLKSLTLPCPFNDCIDGKCSISQLGNNSIKNQLKYQENLVFMISDEKWQNVLSLIPIAIWKDENTIKKYPILIYSSESSFDVDSAKRFLENYRPSKIIHVGTIHRFIKNQLNYNIEEINTIDYLRYWDSIKEIVYSEDNYEIALLASTYASIINAPLIIEGNKQKNLDFIYNNNLICVGNIRTDIDCKERYNLQQLRQKYIEKTNTNKLILVNPSDLQTSINSRLTTTQGKRISKIFGKTSLSAPILASGKEELIISINSVDYTEIDSFVENEINRLNMNPRYLTIVASPLSIPISKPLCGIRYWEALDTRYYGTLNGGEYFDLSTGRIYSLTITDTSSYMNRALFYDYLELNNPNSRNFVIALGEAGTTENWSKSLIPRISRWRDYTGGNTWIWTDAIEQNIRQNYNVQEYYSGEGFNYNLVNYESIKFLLYSGHGGSFGLPGLFAYQHSDNGFNLNNQFAYTAGCYICSFMEESPFNYWNYCPRQLRQGAIGGIASVTLSHKVGYLNELLNKLIINPIPIGDALRESQNFDVLHHGYSGGGGDRDCNPTGDMSYMLMGDPTIILR